MINNNKPQGSLSGFGVLGGKPKNPIAERREKERKEQEVLYNAAKGVVNERVGIRYEDVGKTDVKRVVVSKKPHPTNCILGVRTDGSPYTVNIADGPHWIVCGMTGSGKSVMLNQILCTMMIHAHPSQLQLLIVDPKKVEFTRYEKSPYLMAPPIKDMQNAYAAMKALVWLMDERYSKLAQVGVAKIDEFNAWIDKHPEEAKAKNLEKMPFIVTLIDEWADLMMQEKDAEGEVVRLAQKSRACGIHVIIATQRPSVDIISSNIKGYGDCFVRSFTGDLDRVQGAYLSNEEIEAIVDYTNKAYSPVHKFDYKELTVQIGAAEWKEDYDESISWDDKIVKKVRARPGVR